MNNHSTDEKFLWYKDAIIYELHIKAYADSNGDGIGDFGGLIQKLDYLQELGITAVWVLPFYPSPLRDDGYDIADYYSINPNYGNLDDFKKFLEEAHKRDLKVITELVINHTSDQHPWFQRARRSPQGSRERNYYVWTDNPDQYSDVRIIFQDFEASNWSWDPIAQQYYWHRFFHHQPDLNYDSEDVQQEIFKILEYWCEMGVDGFRLDAVPYLFEREGTNGENLPETHAFLKKLRKYIDDRYPGICFLAEANMWPEDSASYFGDGDECHMNYHFPVMPRMFMSLQREDRYPLTDIFDQTPAIPPNCQWAIFLRNHDELTLEMVTDEERDYMYKVYAKDPKAKINLGIRHRLAPLMENDRRRIELMNSLLFSLPGTPVIYYGDEIGMGDNFYLGDRDGVRTPMQWSPDRNAGFSDANPQRLYLPVILDPQYHFESVNVETQKGNTTSLFWFMKRILHMRKKYKAFSRGDLNFIHVDNPKILAFTRQFEDETMFVILNLSKYAQPAEIDLTDFSKHTLIEVFSKNAFPAIRENSAYFFTMAAHSFHWFLVQKPKTAIQKDKQTRLVAENVDSLFLDESLETLQTKILPEYISQMDWFATNKTVYSTTVMDQTAIPVGEKEVHILLIEVNFESGLPEIYQLPVMFVNDKEGKMISDNYPSSIITEASVGRTSGYLCDAVYDNGFQNMMLESFAENKKFMGNGEIVFESKNGVQEFVQKRSDRSSKVHASYKMYTAITYSNKYFLKIYRRVDKGQHPDAEVTKYLSETTEGITTYYSGNIDWVSNGASYNLGMLEKLEENHGDGHQYMLDRISNYIERILARDRQKLAAYKVEGSYSEPVAFDDLTEKLKEFLGTNAAEAARLAGQRLGQIHRSLATGFEAGFSPEDFSLHYQRSLYSGMTSLVREVAQTIEKKAGDLPKSSQDNAKHVRSRRDQLLKELKKIYRKKFDVQKIRVHGNMGLRHVLMTGRNLIIHDFGGNPLRPFSERRLKRSPLRDVASMIHSLYYVVYKGFLGSANIERGELENMMHYADLWAHYMSMFFIRAYKDETKDQQFLPKTNDDIETLINCFLLERSLVWFNYELNHDPQKAAIMLRVLKKVMEQREVW